MRPVQQFSKKKEVREDPDIGLPATFGRTPEGPGREHGQAEEGAQQGTEGEGGHHGNAQRGVSRERWSFRPNKTWVERPRRPLTRSVTGKRQETRERAQHRAEGRGSQSERRRRA